MSEAIERWVPGGSVYHRNGEWWQCRTARLLVPVAVVDGTANVGDLVSVRGKSQGLIVAPVNKPAALFRVRPAVVEVQLREGEKVKA